MNIRERILAILAKFGADDVARSTWRRVPGTRPLKMRFPPYGADIQRLVDRSPDPFRYGTVAVAVQRVIDQKLPGSFAEVGVYRGELSRLIHTQAPDRELYLFDTFEGFPAEDLDGRADSRFRDTSVESVQRRIGDTRGVRIRKGRFPDTAVGLEGETFAFVVLDLDLYGPTAAALSFFYPRLAPGGFLIVDDYNNSESGWGVHRAVDEFIHDKPEQPVELADTWGSIVLRKV